MLETWMDSLKLGVQVSIGYGIIENGNSHWKLKKSKYGEFWATGDTYAVIGQPSNLVYGLFFF
jgi:hypothetical protein